MYLDMFMVLAGGGLGALLRYLITLAVYGDKAPAFPYGTLIVNLLGCLCVGLLAGYFQRYPELPMFLKLFAITGVMGGLTTFSTFSLETFNLLYLHPAYAVANITCSVAAGLICVAVGMQVIQSIL